MKKTWERGPFGDKTMVVGVIIMHVLNNKAQDITDYCKPMMSKKS